MLDGKVNEQSLTCLRQIEVNTVSSALAGQATRMPELHRYTCALRDDLTSDGQKDQIPDNPVVDEIATGIAAAWQAYGSSSTVVVMLVGCDESNVFDQLLVEDALLMNHGINMVRCIFDDIVKGGSMQVSVNRDGTAFIGNHEVAVFYFRHGYNPLHYSTEKHWDARLLIEKSRSVVCPSVAEQLAGTKRVQMELGRPGVLERFVNSSAASRIRETFCNMYSLDLTDEGNEVAVRAVANPQLYVMKSEREGGGSIVAGESMKSRLNECFTSKERSSFILMDKVFAPVSKSYIIHSEQAADFVEVDVVSELGVYGVYVKNTITSEVEMNTVAGHLLRTKNAQTEGGGVVHGTAAFDSPLLV
ncbi:glutathione synthetase-like isoform X2 [Corticium candelabrum]|nr:glutathione synthetase-like isoform X2 [Corticium candelabrum]XP_062501009.1 glutathione synthetase-like isoform X2 [Corticium candelabrum]